MGLELNDNVTTEEDKKYIGKAKFDPSKLQDPCEILLSRGFRRFRFLLQGFSIEQIAILIHINNPLLNKRIFLHLSEKSKKELINFIGNYRGYTPENVRQTLVLIDFEMDVA